MVLDVGLLVIEGFLTRTFFTNVADLRRLVGGSGINGVVHGVKGYLTAARQEPGARWWN